MRILALPLLLACSADFTTVHTLPPKHRMGAAEDPGSTEDTAPPADDGGSPDTGGGGSDGTPVDTADPVDTGDPAPDVPGPLLGIDISHWNAVSDWDLLAAQGVWYATMKATEGTYYKDSAFSGEWDGATNAGMLRGAYHFAIPDDSDGATQADYFVDHGGDWSPDGRTLPGTLDIEYNPYGDTCYGLSKSAMAAWVTDFNEQYLARTGRYPTIYTNANWWDNCVGSAAFADTNPLWVAHYGASSPNLPEGWAEYTFWQYTGSGSLDGIDGDVDLDTFPGSLDDLIAFADEG